MLTYWLVIMWENSKIQQYNNTFDIIRLLHFETQSHVHNIASHTSMNYLENYNQIFGWDTYAHTMHENTRTYIHLMFVSPVKIPLTHEHFSQHFDNSTCN